MVDSPHPFAGSALGFDSPAVPVSAVMNGPVDRLDVTFDKPLIASPALDHTNWTARHGNLAWIPTAAQVAGPLVQITGAVGAGDPGADVCAYAPPPFDLITLPAGPDVVAFADFPIT